MPRFLPLLLALSALLPSCGRPSQPSGARSDALTLEASAGDRLVTAELPSVVTVRVALGVKPMERSGRPAANLALVVDTSGSMEGKAIEDARRAATALVDSLSPKDRLAIVVFNSQTETLLPSTLLDDADLKDVRAKLSHMRAEGTTDMASGLRAGIGEVTAHLDPEAVNRVILLGDGVPNEEEPIAAIAQSAADHGVSITALGLGADYNETLMGKLAQVTGGRFQYVADSSKVASFFAEEVGRLQKTYVRNAWLDLTAGPGVTIEGVIGQESVRTATGVRVHVGDLALGEKMDVFAKVALAGRKDGAVIELVDAVLRFSEGVGGAQMERRAFVGIHAAKDPAKVTAGRNADVEAGAARAQQAADTLEEIRLARARDVPKPAPAPVTPPTGMLAPPGGAHRRAAAESAFSPALAQDHPEILRKQHDDAMQTLQKH
jgi:Ca-activated chloride channel homolog